LTTETATLAVERTRTEAWVSAFYLAEDRKRIRLTQCQKMVGSVNRAEHRMTEAMMVSVEVFDELTAERNQSVAQAAASMRAEGLAISSDAEAIMERWARGELSTTQMRELVRQLYTA